MSRLSVMTSFDPAMTSIPAAQGPACVSESIAQLTRAMSAGEPAAVERFYRAYFERLYAMARRLTRRDESFCLDIVQDAVLRIVRTVREVQSERQFESWLALVVQTTAYDLLRRERRRTARETLVAGARHESSSPDSASIDQRDRLAWIRIQIEHLDPQIVRIIELRFQRRWTLARIGQLLGLSVGTVDGRLRRALTALRRGAAQEERNA